MSTALDSLHSFSLGADFSHSSQPESSSPTGGPTHTHTSLNSDSSIHWYLAPHRWAGKYHRQTQNNMLHTLRDAIAASPSNADNPTASPLRFRSSSAGNSRRQKAETSPCSLPLYDARHRIPMRTHMRMRRVVPSRQVARTVGTVGGEGNDQMDFDASESQEVRSRVSPAGRSPSVEYHPELSPMTPKDQPWRTHKKFRSILRCTLPLRRNSSSEANRIGRRDGGHTANTMCTTSNKKSVHILVPEQSSKDPPHRPVHVRHTNGITYDLSQRPSFRFMVPAPPPRKTQRPKRPGTPRWRSEPYKLPSRAYLNPVTSRGKVQENPLSRLPTTSTPYGLPPPPRGG